MIFIVGFFMTAAYSFGATVLAGLPLLVLAALGALGLDPWALWLLAGALAAAILRAFLFGDSEPKDAVERAYHTWLKAGVAVGLAFGWLAGRGIVAPCRRPDRRRRTHAACRHRRCRRDLPVRRHDPVSHRRPRKALILRLN